MKKIVSLILAVTLAMTLFGCSAGKEPETTAPQTTTTTTAPPAVVNPLTGEENYSENAVGKRPVAIVVENLKPARPQWGIKTPDIIVEGEVEGGISRMLWLYADFKSVPEKVGPIRSARPSYVKFSELFDSIYIHWGGSHTRSKYNYIGGYKTIKNDKVDNIDGMKGGELFGRDTTRSTSSEHRGILNGKKLSAAIDKKGYRTELDESKFTTFTFNKAISDAGTDKAQKIDFKFSSRTDTRKFTYKDDKLYHSTDWEEDVAFQNVIILMDDTTYITLPYKSSSTTYLNYTLKSGTGYIASNGTKTNIKWAVQNGKLVLTDENGQAVSLNPGKSYIGLGSSNHEGSVKFTAETE